MRLKLFIRLSFLFAIINCNNKNEISKNHISEIQLDSTEKANQIDSFDQPQSEIVNNLNENANLINGDILFLDYKFGMTNVEIETTTRNLIRQKKIRKVGENLYYDFFINNKIFNAKLTFNTILSNKLFAVYLFFEYFPFNDSLDPKQYDLKEIENIVKINNQNFNLIKNLYVKKYGNPIKNNKYISLESLGKFDKIEFENRHKELADRMPNSHPKFLFESKNVIVSLSSSIYGGVSIAYNSRKMSERLSNQEDQKTKLGQKKNIEDI